MNGNYHDKFSYLVIILLGILALIAFMAVACEDMT